MSARYGTSAAFNRSDWNNLNLQEIEYACRNRALVSQLVARCNGAVDDCTCNVNDVNAVLPMAVAQEHATAFLRNALIRLSPWTQCAADCLRTFMMLTCPAHVIVQLCV